MENQNFCEGKYDTHFIEKNIDDLLQETEYDTESEDIALFVAYLDYTEKMKKQSADSSTVNTGTSNGWKDFAKRKNVLRF